MKAIFKTGNSMIFMGVLVLSLGLGNAWRQYSSNHSILDMVDLSPQSLDLENFSSATSIQPTRTPFQPSTLTPFQPLEDQAALAQAIPGSILDATPTPSSTQAGLVPDRLVIPSILLDAPVVPIHYKSIEFEDQTLQQWLVPNAFAVGWHDTSAGLGVPGNTVLNGHHNAYGEVFKDLINLEQDDRIQVYSGGRVFTYRVMAKMLFPERYRPVEERIANARWILPSNDERLTLNTCWPPESNTDRIVIVAFPIGR
jgi:hypothetical protein